MPPKSHDHNPSRSLDCQNALVVKIALFLNFLSRKNYQRLARDTGKTRFGSEGELLKFMIDHNLVTPADAQALKTTCLKFAKAQADTRFGSLCIEFEFLTPSNLNLALEEQKTLADHGRNMFLGDLLVEAGMISERQRKLILQKQKMDHDFRDASGTVPGNATEIREKDLIFHIPENGLTAYMLKADTFDSSMLLADLKEIIEQNGIIYGVASDEALKSFMAEDRYRTARFEVAKGLEPVQGQDARIFILFEQDYLTPGQVRKDGSIDFKSRGEIPFVSADDVLAEKIPAQAGRDGVNVFGDVVRADPPVDMEIVCGQGTCLSQDRLKACAVTEGYPKLTREGALTVTNAHVIQGDVDFTTGHIKFSRNIFITGTVKAGFRVEAIDVVARAVDGGTIIARGDLAVANGITNADVICHGNVSAGFVHRSKIACMGDMEIDKEVVESRVALEGTFEMTQGKMYATDLSARGGAKIWHIGSEKTRPVNIAVGTSTVMADEIERINIRIEKNQARTDQKTAALERIRAELSDTLEKRDKLKLDEARMEAGQYHELMAGLKARSQSHEARMAAVNRELKILAEQIKQLIAEKFNLQHQGHANPAKPILDVRGRVLGGTIIRGRNASTIVSTDLARVRILEMSVAHDRKSNKKSWEMIVTRL